MLSTTSNVNLDSGAAFAGVLDLNGFNETISGLNGNATLANQGPSTNVDQVLPRQRLLDEVWGYNFFGDENNVEVYIRYLRNKLGDNGHQRIQTVRGVGYRLRSEVAAAAE